MKIVFLLGSFNIESLGWKCAPCSALVIDGQRWLQEQAKDTKSDFGQFVLNNWSGATNEPLINQYVTEAIRDNTAVDLLFVSQFPTTQFQFALLPMITLGHQFVILDKTGSEFVHTSVHRVKDLDEALAVIIDEQQYRRLSIAPMPARRINAQISHAMPFDAAEVIQLTLRLAQSPRLKRQFCGSYPISLERKHIAQLLDFPYHVSLKIDGYRMFAVTWRGRVWFVNRKMDVFEGPVCADENETLLDCEYCPQNSLFYVCDCLCVGGGYTGDMPLLKRLACAKAIGSKLHRLFAPQTFVPLQQLAELWERRKTRTCPIDGLVFTPSELPYRLGIDYKMFKWKEDSDNTVDLLFNNNKLFCRSSKTSLPVEIGSVAKAALTPENNTIYECRTTAVSGQWEVMKSRNDKPHPNLEWVVENVLNSISSAITVDELIKLSRRI